MKVFIGCEYSGTVRDAFLDEGHYAVSCDLEPSESEGPHIIGDVAKVLQEGPSYDLIILHPPCQYMALCGNRHWAGSPERKFAVTWTLMLWHVARDRSCRVVLENPASVIFPYARKFGAKIQYIQPWMFGHPEQKRTGLALYGVPPLKPTKNVEEEMKALPRKERERIFYMSPSAVRGKERARFYKGIAKAMATQWGTLEEV